MQTRVIFFPYRLPIYYLLQHHNGMSICRIQSPAIFIRYIPGFDERWYVLCIIPPREITVRATISVKQDKNK
jgi:hypothetical protein